MLGRTNTGGGGSGGLNFQVIGGTTAPSNPKENMIWVNTSTKITSYIFSATEPATAEEGMVWIYTSKSSAAEFNALKKNGIQVYPISAKQYVSGALVDKPAKIYQGGEWVALWNGELYDSGNEFTDITGGFNINKEDRAVISFEDSFIEISYTNDIGASGAIMTNKKIDIRGRNFLKMSVDTMSLPGTYFDWRNVGIGIASDPLSSFHPNFVASVYTQQSDVISLNLKQSGITGTEYYVAIEFTLVNATISKIWLE